MFPVLALNDVYLFQTCGDSSQDVIRDRLGSMGLYQASGHVWSLLGNSTASKRHSPALTDDEWTLYISISVGLVLLAGLMSGLTLGLMSLNVLDMEVCMASMHGGCSYNARVPQPLTLYPSTGFGSEAM